MRAENVSRARRYKRHAWLWLLSVVLQGVLFDAPRAGEGSGPRPGGDTAGVAQLPAISVPPSRFMSPEARKKFIRQFSNPEAGPPPGADVRQLREYDERKNAPFVARAETLYPVNIEPKLIGGVRTRVITPKAGVAPRNLDRGLVNLPVGGL